MAKKRDKPSHNKVPLLAESFILAVPRKAVSIRLFTKSTTEDMLDRLNDLRIDGTHISENLGTTSTITSFFKMTSTSQGKQASGLRSWRLWMVTKQLDRSGNNSILIGCLRTLLRTRTQGTITHQKLFLQSQEPSKLVLTEQTGIGF